MNAAVPDQHAKLIHLMSSGTHLVNTIVVAEKELGQIVTADDKRSDTGNFTTYAGYLAFLFVGNALGWRRCVNKWNKAYLAGIQACA